MLSLPDLPLEVLEAICRPLQLRDRLVLTSCCRTLLARPDVAGSAELWGSLGRKIYLGSSKESLSAGFFARHAAGVRKLHVKAALRGGTNEQLSADLAALLGTLGGSGLIDLEIFGPTDPGTALQPLSHLTALTRLQIATRLVALPAHVSALQRLAHLDLSENLELGRLHGPAFEGLAHLLDLTSLSLCMCNLRVLPPQLSALTRLQVLLLGGNPHLAEGDEAVFEGLRHLPALRVLDLAGCGLQAVPRQLAALPALAALEIGINQALGGNDPVLVLCQLTSLTSLSICTCQLTRAPPQLASLTALVYLELGDNPLGQLGAGEQAFLPLEHLTGLTRLGLQGYLSGQPGYWANGLRDMPPQLAALTGLVKLDLSSNPALGDLGEAAFQPLLRLSALTSLKLRRAGLTSLPSRLLGLGSCLLRLDVSQNWGLADNASGQAFQPLCYATALTALSLADCSLEQLPEELSALGTLQELELGGNRRLGLGANYEQVFGPLRPLRGLTHLVLRNAGLLRLPPQLSELRALRGLNVSWNSALWQKQRGAVKMWRHLSGLTALERLEVFDLDLGRPAPPALLELARRGVDVNGLPGRME